MTTAKILTDEKAIEAIKKAATKGTMRRIYDNMESAIAAMNATGPLAEQHGVPIKAADPEAFDGHRPVIAIVGARKEVKGEDGKKRGIVGAKAIAFFPMPTLEAFMADEKGRDWLEKVAEKEAAHVIFRPLRNAESAEELDAAEMPLTVEDIVTSARADAIDTDWFDAVWPIAREAMKSKAPKLYSALPKQKAELTKSLRSKSYAEAQYEALEKANAFTGALAAFLRRAGEVNTAEDGSPDPIDTAELNRWLEERDERVLTAPKPVDYSEIEGQDFSKVDLGF